jgi:epoxyqueuosine reductase
MGIKELTESIKSKALEVGFDLIGVSPVERFPETEHFREWLSKGYAGDMQYMERNPGGREDPGQTLPGAKSIVSCGLNYNTAFPYSIGETDKKKGWIARYAWGDDYHVIMDERLRALEDFIQEESSPEGTCVRYTDTGPVLERVYGKYGGIGWIGKNTCLINQRIGSWIFLGEIITNIELEYDGSPPDRCGTCTRCIDACPTGAIVEPYVLDSRLCVSYLTIESKDKIPYELRDGIDNNIFGCDICQDVCPWNRKALRTKEPSFQPRDGLYNPPLKSISGLGADEFGSRFKGSSIKRAKRKGFLRNILTAMGNSADNDLVPMVESYLTDEEPLVRAHAVWALWRLKGEGSADTLLNHKKNEKDPAVLEEIDEVLNGSRSENNRRMNL